MTFIDNLKGKKVFHITDKDLDGIVSKLISHYYLEPKCNITYHVLENKDWDQLKLEKLKDSDYILFTDIAPPIEVYQYIKNLPKNPQIYIFDHHISSRKLLGNVPNYYYTIDYCGAKIFYDFITHGRRKHAILDKVVYLTNIYDLFETTNEDFKIAKKLNHAMFGTVNWREVFGQFPPSATDMYDKFIDIYLKKMKYHKHFYFSQSELDSISRAEEKEKSSHKKAKKTLKYCTDSKGNNYGIFECESNKSWIAYLILNENPTLKYVIMKSMYDKDTLKVSVRSNNLNDFDVTHLAEKWGGGGHKHASGILFGDKDIHDRIFSGKIDLFYDIEKN